VIRNPYPGPNHQQKLISFYHGSRTTLMRDIDSAIWPPVRPSCSGMCRNG